jgi:hypothetical protein
MIKDGLNHVEENATKSTYKSGIGFERCEDKGEKSALKFVSSSNYHKEEEHSNPPKLTTDPIQSHFQPQERGKERNTQVKRGSFYLHVLWPC